MKGIKYRLKNITAISLVVIIIAMVFLVNINNVYGAVNNSYGTADVQSGSIDLDKASKDSVILDGIGHLAYVLAGFVEKHVGYLINSFTGSNIFPWADKIIFNTIPFLDINFINSSKGSLFTDLSGEDTLFGTIIRNIYYTIFVLSIAFFGIVVGIMALRLAISTIASEKAKYKEAITNWLLALILIFTAHYLMSFIFWVNEKMVETASLLLLEQIEKNYEKIDVNFSAGIDEDNSQEFTEIVLDAYFATRNSRLSGAIECDNECFTLYLQSSALMPNQINLVVNGDGNGNVEYRFFNKLKEKNEITKDSFLSYDQYLLRPDNIITVEPAYRNWSDVVNNTIEDKDDATQNEMMRKFSMYMSALIGNTKYLNARPKLQELIADQDLVVNVTGGSLVMISVTSPLGPVGLALSAGGTVLLENFVIGDSMEEVRAVINDALFLLNKDPMFNNGKNQDNIENAQYFSTAVDNDKWIDQRPYTSEIKAAIVEVYNTINPDTQEVTSGSYKKEQAIVSNLSQFFKSSIYIGSIDLEYKEKENGELFNSEFQPIIAILYAIFVVQSLMYFIAYIRRFFYVVILALFAPLVIVYDFLIKSTMS